ncbi:MAG TPA: hypothetical protein VKN36_13275 [Eudoraea sp.]|nr:hypothetical protein [Eudoraea sp.]
MMKKIVLLITALALSTMSTMAATAENKVALSNAYRYDNSFIFVENGITFSVYPDGEFDFYIDSYVSGRKNGITFNSGYDYSPYAQYDDYGAVIQVENVPVYYDYYGRVTQIGSVDINYRNGRVRRVGGLHVYYNHNGYYDYHTGYINVYNRYYVYRPYHGLFVRPALGFCLVFGSPYRRYYSPLRYTYYAPYRHNYRRAYAHVGKHYTYDRGHKRHQVYRNDKRVAVRSDNDRRDGLRTNRVATRSNSGVRSDSRVNRKGEVGSTDRSINRSNIRKSGDSQRSSAQGSNTVTRSDAKRSGGSERSTVNGASRERSSTIARSNVRKGEGSKVRSSSGKTVTKRSVTTTPRSKTITRSTTTYSRPQSRSTAGSRSVSTKSRSQSTAKARPASRSSSGSKVSKSPARSSRSSSGSTQNRSSRTRVQ